MICWQAVEAIAAVVAAGFAGYILFIELPKIKRESASKKVESLDYALNHLESGISYQQEYMKIMEEWRSHNTEYPQKGLHYVVETLFSRLDYIGLLIKLDYVDEDLLFYKKADTLYDLERAITNFEHRENTRIPIIRKSFPRGYKLLKKAARYSRRKSRRI